MTVFKEYNPSTAQWETILVGDRGPVGPALNILGTFSSGPTIGDDGDAYINSGDGHIYTWDNDTLSWVDKGQFVGPTGATGPTGPPAGQPVATTDSPTFANVTVNNVLDLTAGSLYTGSIDGFTDGGNYITLYTNDGTISTYGVLQAWSGLYVEGTSNFTGAIKVESVSEKFNTVAVSSNVITLDYSQQSIIYQPVNITANFTVNVTNVPTDNLYMTTVSVFVEQGATGYRPSTLQIAGTSQTIKWSGGTAPTPTSSAGKIDLFSFTLIRRNNAWTVLGSANLNY